MKKGRMEAFSDGVIAIIITIMVLELKIPHGGEIASIEPLIPVFLGYVLSFIFVAIFWNAHHHLIHAVTEVNGNTLWANSHFLFWLSLVPFTTGWMGENISSPTTCALYGINLMFLCTSYYTLEHVLIFHHGKESPISKIIGVDKKGIITIFVYLLAIPMAFFLIEFSYACYIAVALFWMVPNRKIEVAVNEKNA